MSLTKVTSSMMKGQSLTFQIPTDFPSLQAAVDSLSPTVLNDSVVLNIESGHKITSGLIVENGDYTQFTVTSTDATVLLADSWVAGTALLTGTNATLPNWNIFVDCEGKDVNPAGDRGAINVLENSTLLLGNGAGCTNGATGNNGLFVYRNSRVTGDQCVFTNFPLNNIWVTHASVGYLERVVATGAGQHGVFVSRASNVYAAGGDFSDAGQHGAEIRRSRFTAIPAVGQGAKFNNCGARGISATANSLVVIARRTGVDSQIYDCPIGIASFYGSNIDARGALFKNNSTAAILSQGGAVEATAATFTTVSGYAIEAKDGAFIEATGITANNVGKSVIFAVSGSKVVAESSAMDGAGEDAVISTLGSMVDVRSSSIKNAVGNALFADGGGEIIALDCDATGSSKRGAAAANGSHINVARSNLSNCTDGGIRATTGSRVTANNVNAQTGGSPATSDVLTRTGSIIQFNGGTGGLGQTANTITSDGIIFA